MHSDMTGNERIRALAEIIGAITDKSAAYSTKGNIDIYTGSRTNMTIKALSQSDKIPYVHAYSNLSYEWIDEMLMKKRAGSAAFLQEKLDWMNQMLEQLANTPVEDYRQKVCGKPLFKLYDDIRPVIRHKSILRYLEPDVVTTELENTDLVVMYLAYLPEKIRCLITKDILAKEQITDRDLLDESVKRLDPRHFSSYAYNDSLTDINAIERYNTTYDANAILCKPLLRAIAGRCKSTHLILVPAAVTRWHFIAAAQSEAVALKDELHDKLHTANVSAEMIPIIKLSDSLYLYEKATDEISTLYQGDTDLYTNGGPMP